MLSLIMKKINRLTFSVDRSVSDKKKNNYHGSRLMFFCNSLGLYKVNGRVGKDHWIDSTTWNDASTIDYVILLPEGFL